MNNKFEISTPLGDFSIKLENEYDQFFLPLGNHKDDDIQTDISIKKIDSPNPPKADQPDEVYVMKFVFTVLQDINDMALLFDFENRQYFDTGTSDSGEHFESVCWDNNEHIAHLGFRTALDEGYIHDGFDLLEMVFPDKKSKALKLVFPKMKKNEILEFTASFAWTKKKHKTDCATVLAADYALAPISIENL